jgi:cob(I)alamin adenosyltransferase
MGEDASAKRPARVVTRSGDSGETGMGRGVRVAKCAARVEAYGTVDEASSAIGVLRAHLADRPDINQRLARIQGELFDIGADLHMPGEAGARLRVGDAPLLVLESELADLDAGLPPLDHFILPSGALPVAHAHLARTVVRRAERRVVALAREEEVNPAVLRYLNRLSDYLFVLARRLDDGGTHESPWPSPA